MRDRIEIIQGNITEMAVDAIVNAANPSLRGGGGVDGAIQEAAGPGMLQACERIGRCPTGQARITPGFRLPARYVIHTAGPAWRGGDEDEDDLLTSCYRSVFAIVERERLDSVALPSIATGAYGFPVERASRIALKEARDFLARNREVDSIKFVCFDEATLEAYQAAAEEILTEE